MTTSGDSVRPVHRSAPTSPGQKTSSKYVDRMIDCNIPAPPKGWLLGKYILFRGVYKPSFGWGRCFIYRLYIKLAGQWSVGGNSN